MSNFGILVINDDNLVATKSNEKQKKGSGEITDNGSISTFLYIFAATTF